MKDMKVSEGHYDVPRKTMANDQGEESICSHEAALHNEKRHGTIQIDALH